VSHGIRAPERARDGLQTGQIGRCNRCAGVWTSRFFGIHDPDALDEHFFNGLLGILILLSSSSTSNSLCGLRKACNATERSFQIAPPSSVGKSIATALLVVEYALLLTKETTKSLNRAAPLSKLILTQFR
jgi:hypothetical protein